MNKGAAPVNPTRAPKVIFAGGFGPSLTRTHESTAAAPRQAQLEMSRTKRSSAPFYWAGLVL